MAKIRLSPLALSDLKEIKDYHESLFFGLSTRQFICSVAAVGAAVGIYFGLKNYIDKETVSWLCIACAAPIAVAGFWGYGSLVRNLGGEVITLSTSSENHINALEINSDIDMDENPVSIKSEFLISLFDQLLKSTDSRLGGGVGAKDKSIIDRCAIKVYGDFLNGKSEYMPTLVDFRNELLRQPEDEAGDLALSLEIFTTGSLDAFAHQSDVNVNNRIVAYDILELGEQMKSIGLLIMLDNIFNRVMANRKRGKYTRVYVDEAHLYFKNPYSADFLLKCWKRFRKYGGLLTGITQKQILLLQKNQTHIIRLRSKTQIPTKPKKYANISVIETLRNSTIPNAVQSVR